MSAPILELRNVQTHFPVERGILFKKQTGTVKAVDNVSLEIKDKEFVVLVLPRQSSVAPCSSVRIR
jgi:ABC-type oligopeptide transport system ATPase subunit